jgi:hypothetical protein
MRLGSQRFDRHDLFRPAVLDGFELFASAEIRLGPRPRIGSRHGKEGSTVRVR